VSFSASSRRRRQSRASPIPDRDFARGRAHHLLQPRRARARTVRLSLQPRCGLGRRRRRSKRPKPNSHTHNDDRRRRNQPAPQDIDFMDLQRTKSKGCLPSTSKLVRAHLSHKSPCPLPPSPRHLCARQGSAQEKRPAHMSKQTSQKKDRRAPPPPSAQTDHTTQRISNSRDVLFVITYVASTTTHEKRMSGPPAAMCACVLCGGGAFRYAKPDEGARGWLVARLDQAAARPSRPKTLPPAQSLLPGPRAHPSPFAPPRNPHTIPSSQAREAHAFVFARQGSRRRTQIVVAARRHGALGASVL
jgi:hypothetical protein